MKQPVKTLLASLLLFFITTGVIAQDKYDFAILYLDMTKPVIHFIQNDIPVKIMETGKKNTDNDGQYESLLSEVSQLTKEGWEVINVTGYPVFTFYFRKKKA